MWFEDKDRDKDLRFEDKDKDLLSEGRGQRQGQGLVNWSFPQEKQHRVTARNGLLADINK